MLRICIPDLTVRYMFLLHLIEYKYSIEVRTRTANTFYIVLDTKDVIFDVRTTEVKVDTIESVDEFNKIISKIERCKND